MDWSGLRHSLSFSAPSCGTGCCPRRWSSQLAVPRHFGAIQATKCDHVALNASAGGFRAAGIPMYRFLSPPTNSAYERRTVAFASGQQARGERKLHACSNYRPYLLCFRDRLRMPECRVWIAERIVLTEAEKMDIEFGKLIGENDRATMAKVCVLSEYSRLYFVRGSISLFC